MMRNNMMMGRPFFTNSQDPPFRGRAAGDSRPKTPLGSTEPPGSAPSDDSTFGPTTMDEMMDAMDAMDGDMGDMDMDGDNPEAAPGDMANDATEPEQGDATAAPTTATAMEEVAEPDQRRANSDDSKSFDEFEPTAFPTEEGR